MSSAPGEAIISIRELRKIYRVGEVDVEALRGVSLEVPQGEFLSIIGPSGSGKSTLFNIIGGLTPPTSGHVRVDHKDLASLSDAGRTRLRKRTVGFVFQKFNLLPNLTARDNIAIARYIGGGPPEADADFQNILKLLGISNRLDHKPNALSGGEQQRVALARAIVNHPADSAGGRAHGQSGFGQFRRGSGHCQRSKQTPGANGSDDHAQPRSRGLRRPHRPDAGRPYRGLT